MSETPDVISAAAVAYTAVEAWHHEKFEQCADMLLLLGYGCPAMDATVSPDMMYIFAGWIQKLTLLYRDEWKHLHEVGLLYSPYACSANWQSHYGPALANPLSEKHREVLEAGKIVWPPSETEEATS